MSVIVTSAAGFGVLGTNGQGQLQLEGAHAWNVPGGSFVPSAAAIVTLGRRHGFSFVALDLAGFASGSLNQLVGLGRRPAS